MSLRLWLGIHRRSAFAALALKCRSLGSARDDDSAVTYGSAEGFIFEPTFGMAEAMP